MIGDYLTPVLGILYVVGLTLVILYVASRMVGTERSRGYCLELICADFLAGRTEESTPEEILLVIHRLVNFLPADYQARLAGPLERAELEPARKC